MTILDNFEDVQRAFASLKGALAAQQMASSALFTGLIAVSPAQAKLAVQTLAGCSVMPLDAHTAHHLEELVQCWLEQLSEDPPAQL